MNTKPLVEYFLSKKYLKDINVNNPLGSKGEITKKFGHLIIKAWAGSRKVIEPDKLK
jgi:ubiquitin carboxyl-terminal hydrolase 4/11/15